jgi:hypothetical protein
LARFVSGIALSIFLSNYLVAAVAQQTNKLPSATEVFQLRTACASLSEKLMRIRMADTARVEGKVGYHVDAFNTDLKDQFDQTSHYDPATNRCYALLIRSYARTDSKTVVVNGKREPLYNSIEEQYLLDGQTGEMLAFTKEITAAPVAGGEITREGEVYEMRRTVSTSWQDASDYIGKKMADDRR